MLQKARQRYMGIWELQHHLVLQQAVAKDNRGDTMDKIEQLEKKLEKKRLEAQKAVDNRNIWAEKAQEAQKEIQLLESEYVTALCIKNGLNLSDLKELLEGGEHV